MSQSLIGKVLGKYKIIQKLGSGGMADVYKGIQIGLDREVAIKVLPPAFASDREMVKRFRRESQATAKLSHPNIITIYDSGEQEGYYYYVMEYLKADSLEDVLEKEKPLQLQRALKITQDVLKALVYCHEKEVLHRDLKPANIKFDLRENAILTDFGLVKEQGETAISQSGVLLGTPQYLSPEQIKGSEPDVRSDLYQVGVTLYEMLTGRTPIQVPQGGNLSASKLLGQKTPVARELNPEIPEDLDLFLTKSIQEEATDRFQTAKDMLAELKKVELKQKAKKLSTRTSSQISRPSSMLSASSSQTGSLSSSALSMSASSASASGTGFVSSLSAIWASPKDREALVKLLAITIPVFLVGVLGVLWAFGLLSKAPARLLEQAREVEASRATISWKTAPECYSQVEYWQSSSAQEKLKTKRLSMMQTEHRHVLPDLKPDTQYNFRFLFSYNPDTEGDMTPSEIFDFVTRPEIQIFNIHVEEHSTMAVITWETNLRTDTTVKYGQTEQYEDQKTNPEQKSETIHNLNLEGLTPNTAYYYQIVASDPRGRGQPKTVEDRFRTSKEEKEESSSNPNSGLINLTKSYVDKLTRMTPDEREKLKSSIQKFTDPKIELTPTEKKELAASVTKPDKEDEFNNRLQKARSWIAGLKAKGKPIGNHESAAKSLQVLYYTNRLKAAKRLDALFKDLLALE